jgi:hypothetical protein
MSLSTGTQILSFENFSGLENHLRALKNKYTDMIKNYEETLGYILRDTRTGSAKVQKVQQQWALDMQKAMTTTAAKDKNVMKREESKPKMFGNGKDKNNEKSEASGEWITLEPMSLFVGPKARGLAEIYFDTVNILKENVIKINMALSVCSSLKAKAASAGGTSLVVSFVDDLPTKVVLKAIKDGGQKKYSMAFTFAVPSLAYNNSR